MLYEVLQSVAELFNFREIFRTHWFVAVIKDGTRDNQRVSYMYPLLQQQEVTQWNYLSNIQIPTQNLIFIASEWLTIGMPYPNPLLILLLLMTLKHCWTDIIVIVYLILVISVFMDVQAKAFIFKNTNTKYK